MKEGGGTLKAAATDCNVGDLSDSASDGMLTLGGDRPGNDAMAQGDKRNGNAGPTRPGSTLWGVLVRSTNVGDPKIDGGKGPWTRPHGHV